MKKIGICTLHFANNFGAILQAFALQEALKNLGYEVEFLKLLDLEKEIELENIEDYERSKEHLNVNSEIFDKLTHDYDAIVIGSDEVWNVNNKSFEHLEEYLGYNLGDGKIITYAPSANGATIERFREVYGEGNKFEKIHTLSARDEKTKELAESISGKEVTLVIDPTLLIDFEPYLKYKDPELKDYIAIYGYEFTDEEKERILTFAKAKNKKVYSLGFKMDWCDFLNADVFEFMGYFKNADYVITNTFHGSLFAMILQTEFAIFSKTSTKIKDLIKRFQMDDRDATNVEDLSTVFDEKVDYETINRVKLQEREESLNYLKRALD